MGCLPLAVTTHFCLTRGSKRWLVGTDRSATQRAKFARKVHKPPLGVNVINFELNGFNVFLWVPWSLSESKVFKFTKYVERNKMHFCP